MPVGYFDSASQKSMNFLLLPPGAGFSGFGAPPYLL
jgi:hypothetical protein